MKYSYYQRLKNMCDAKNSYLCIGLDFDLDKMKNKNVKNLVSLESFIKDVIDSTYDLCAAYKPNFAFFEKFLGNVLFFKKIVNTCLVAL